MKLALFSNDLCVAFPRLGLKLRMPFSCQPGLCLLLASDGRWSKQEWGRAPAAAQRAKQYSTWIFFQPLTLTTPVTSGVFVGVDVAQKSS